MENLNEITSNGLDLVRTFSLEASLESSGVTDSQRGL